MQQILEFAQSGDTPPHPPFTPIRLGCTGSHNRSLHFRFARAFEFAQNLTGGGVGGSHFAGDDPEVSGHRDQSRTAWCRKKH